MEEKVIPPGQLLKDRYVPIEDIPNKLGVSVETVEKLIEKKKIRYAEFMKPGAYKRSVHVDPVQVSKVLKLKDVTANGE